MTTSEREVIDLSRKDYLGLIEDILGWNKSVRIRVSGTCMAPLIREGDIVEVAPVAGRLKLGDVALLRGDNDYAFVHRVIRNRREEGYVVTKGDFAFTDDGKVDTGRIIGVVTRVHGCVRDLHLYRPFSWISAFISARCMIVGRVLRVLFNFALGRTAG